MNVHELAAVVAVLVGCSGASNAPDANGLGPLVEPRDPSSPPCAGALGFPGLPGVSSFHDELRVGDVNGDGKRDLILRWYTTMSVALGTGNGAFAEPTSFPTPSIAGASSTSADALLLADVNGDGKQDLGVLLSGMMGSATQREIAVLLGDGLGTFTPSLTAAGLAIDASDIGMTGDLKIVLAAAELNGDGTRDVIARGGSKITVWLSSPTGYGSPQTYPIGAGAVQMAVDDVTGDGKPDVVVSSDGEVSVLANTGTGAFAARVAVATSVTAGGVVIIDLDENGRPDIAFGDNNAAGKNVGVVLNQGAGVFGAVTRYPIDLASPSSTLDSADLDGDGRRDIVAGRGAGGFLPGTGTGTLATARAWTVDRSTLADMTGDGRVDIVSDGGVVFVIPNNGTTQPFDGGAADVLRFEPFELSRGARLLDLDADGLSDVVRVTESGRLVTRRAIGGGAFSTQTVSYTSIAPFHTNGKEANGEFLNPTALVDVNSDGRQDLLLQGGAIQTVQNQGDGTLTVKPSSPSVAGTTMIAGDFDGDGFRDLVVPERFSRLGGSQTQAAVYFLRGNGTGGFASGVEISRGPGTVVAAVLDADADGKLDVAVEQAGMRTLLLGKGDGTFSALPPVGVMPGAMVLVARDLDGDGKPDLVSNGGAGLVTYLGHGDGTFSAAITSPGYHWWPAFADFNGDGKLDMASTDGGLTVSLGRGDGSFAAPLHYDARGYQGGAVTVGDVDGDGRVDILVEGFWDELSVHRGRCL